MAAATGIELVCTIQLNLMIGTSIDASLSKGTFLWPSPRVRLSSSLFFSAENVVLMSCHDIHNGVRRVFEKCVDFHKYKGTETIAIKRSNIYFLLIFRLTKLRERRFKISPKTITKPSKYNLKI